VGNELDYALKFTGVEQEPNEAKKSRNAAKKFSNLKSKIFTSDFLEWAIKGIARGDNYDAVLGNPPYIRYQYLDEDDQRLASDIFGLFNLPFTKHTNAWVPFIIASLALLSPGGRLAMVIPAEILHVLHATSLRAFLHDECKRIVVVDPKELIFEEALQGIVLLMIEKKVEPADASEGVAVVSVEGGDLYKESAERIFTNARCVGGDVLAGKWMKVLLSALELEVLERAREKKSVMQFSSIAEVDVGIVTGANKFFLVDDDTVEKNGLSKFSSAMFGRSDHCPGVIYDDAAHERNRAKGNPSNFIYIEDQLENLPPKVRDYIRSGEDQSLHTRYKCRIRNPWYKVPSIYSTPVAMLKRAHQFPRLILNDAEAYTTDTAYRIQPLLKGMSATSMVFSFINSLTALTAELEGRHYGGGVLELVPSEIERLLVPVTKANRPELRKLDTMIKSGASADEILQIQDQVILGEAGFTKNEIKVLHGAWKKIRTRRLRK